VHMIVKSGMAQYWNWNPYFYSAWHHGIRMIVLFLKSYFDK